MMRKLAVTVFALSFAAFGCGSDSDTTPDGGKTDGPATHLDGTTALETQAAPDTSIDVASGPEVQIDATVDVGQLPDAGVDAQGLEVQVTPPTDGGVDVGHDAFKPVDGGVDAPADTAQVVDGQSVDGDFLDGGNG